MCIFRVLTGIRPRCKPCRAELQKLGHEVAIIAPEYPQPISDEPGVERVASRSVWGDPEDRMMRLRALARHLALIQPGQFDFLIRVAAELKRTTHPDIVLLIAGEGPAKKTLQRLGKALELEANLRFVGYLGRGPELSSCYQAGDVFIFASRTETQGLVLLEAMSLGVPVVSTAVMGTREILAVERGALIAEEQAKPFAAQVRRLLGDAGLRQKLGEDGRRYAREWAAQGPAQALLEFYQELKLLANET